MFLPQRTYLPVGSLRQAITYPGAADSYDIADIVQALNRCGLSFLTGRLDGGSLVPAPFAGRAAASRHLPGSVVPPRYSVPRRGYLGRRCLHRSGIVSSAARRIAGLHHRQHCAPPYAGGFSSPAGRFQPVWPMLWRNSSSSTGWGDLIGREGGRPIPLAYGEYLFMAGLVWLRAKLSFFERQLRSVSYCYRPVST